MSKKSSVKFLPDYLRTDKNQKFLSSTFDQFIQTPALERVDGFVGSKLTPNYNSDTDYYLNKGTGLKRKYALDPALVLKDNLGNIKDVVGFDDLLNELSNNNGTISNSNNIFQVKHYAYDPYISWDKLVNYFDYYWLPQGPDTILINDNALNVATEIIGNETYTLPYTYIDDSGNTVNYELSNGMKIIFGNDVPSSQYRNKTFYVEGVGSSITLTDITLLNVSENLGDVHNETYDSDGLDEYPFDGETGLPLVPEYITINRASKDLNPWSRYNRWFHKDIIRIAAEINNLTPEFLVSQRAKRPIIEFKSNIKLYNYGTNGLPNVDLIDSDTDDIFTTVNGQYGYYVDNVLLQSGHRVIFNNDDNNKNKIFSVSFTTGTTSTIVLTTVSQITSSSVVVSINLGDTNGGTNWFYDLDSDMWKFAQQHNEINQFPLFDVFDKNGISYSNTSTYQSNFVGTKVFGYDVGTGVNDTILGFPLKYQNSSGVGSFLFKNYFMTDEINITNNNVSSIQPVSLTYLKNFDTDTYFNVWQEETEYRLPIIEVQTLSKNTSTINVTCFDYPINAVDVSNVQLFKNDVKLSASWTATSSAITLFLDNELFNKDTVVIKVYGDIAPNDNGYFELPLSMVNNPLNESVVDFTLSELKDHLNSMTDDITATIYNGSNLRDIDGYSRYGSRIIINSNPLSYAGLFLGKKENNIIDSIRTVGHHYNQFKSNFLRKILNVGNDIDAKTALDIVLKDINLTKNFLSSYYRSDMLGYGEDKVVNQFTITNVAITDFPIGIDFDLSALSHKSVLVYRNGTQCVHGKDYVLSIDEIQFQYTLTIGDEIEVDIFNNTLGSYIPPTPTKLGLYPKYEPEIFTDNTYRAGSVQMIRGHDGSVMVSYGDYRDNIILEFEKRIYNNIKVNYQPSIYDTRAGIPGAYRNRNNLVPANEILNKDFSMWAGTNNVDIAANTGYDEADRFTWNYKNSVDKVLNEPVPKFWRGIYQYFYDTDHPDTRPWEMLGFVKKPSWWDTWYDWNNFIKRNALIDAIVNGKISEPFTTNVYNPNYARPSFASIVPVNVSNVLLDPSCVVEDNDEIARRELFEFGDIAPAEYAWRNSSYWPYAVNILSALLYPADYLSTMFDTSRISKNILDQITYTQDDLYLDPRKLVLDGEENSLASGYSVFVIEAGKLKDKNYLENLRTDLDNLNFNLFHKLSGFTSKDKLQINIDSIDPVSTSPGLILPKEDYSLILNISNPINIVNISGMVIQRSNGKFIIKGYDVSNPYFDVYLPRKEAGNSTINIGGVSEDFTEWTGSAVTSNPDVSYSELGTASIRPGSRFYKSGQIVRYQGRFYRCSISHSPTATFNNSFWTGMSKLPVQDGISVITSSKFQNITTRYVYGSEIPNIQSVYDIIIGYGAYLESQGFVFEDYSTELKESLDWKYSAKEFLYWCTQNWSDNNIITLSPFANLLQFSYANGVVDDISGLKYQYSLLKADGKPFPQTNYSLVRDNGICKIETKDTEDGIFFASLAIIQKEHALVFNNSTIFNDTIYDLETGFRQRRVKLSGFITKDWNGDLYSPGFVYDDFTISDWVAYRSYEVGSIVRFNGTYYQSNAKIESKEKFDFQEWTLLNDKPIPDLLPNFEYKITQFEDFYSLDVDNFDINQQYLAQHLIGYTPRTYFNNIFTNQISQYKFYQGFIKDKGTKNAIDKLSKATRFLNKGEVTFNEEWAFRLGWYGGYSNFEELEFPLTEGTSLENPYLIKFIDKVPDNSSPLINYITENDLLLSKTDFTFTNVFPTITPESIVVPNGSLLESPSSINGTYNETGLVLATAGYVRLDDVTATAYNKNSLLDIARNNQIQNGSTIWLGFLENGGWEVYRYIKNKAKVSGVFVSAPGQSITFSTNLHHNLSVGDIVSIVNFNNQVNGVYIVDSMPAINQFTVLSNLTSIINEEQLAYGSLFVFKSGRYSDFSKLQDQTDLLNLDQGELIWIDSGVDNRWEVYEKTTDFPTAYIESTNQPSAQELGHTVWAFDNTNTFLVSAPNHYSTGSYSYGRVKVFNRVNNEPNKLFEYTLNDFGINYCNPIKPNEFGYAMAYDRNKNYLIVGAPKASNVRGLSGLEAAPTDVTFSIDILVSNSATVLSASGVAYSINGFYASPDEVTWVLNTTTGLSSVSTSSGVFTITNRIYENEGLVKISSIGPYNDAEVVEAVFINPLSYYSTTSDRARYGHSIYINDAAAAANTLLVVGAPGSPQSNISAYVTPNIVSWMLTTSTGLSSIVSTATSITTGTIGNVYSYKLAKNQNLNVQFPLSGPSVVSTNTVNLKIGDQWGYKVSGNSTGTYLAVSAPFYTDSTSSGIVQIFRYANDKVTHYQTIFSPFGKYGNFGKDHIISYTGKYCIVSVPEYRNSDTSYGSVAIYRLESNLRYALWQTIPNPVASSDLRFGHKVSLNRAENKLLISSLGTNRSIQVNFDKDSKSGLTTFDNDTTRFKEYIEDAGAVYAYVRLGNYFIPGTELVDTEILQGSKFGSSIVSTNNYSYVGAPFSKQDTGQDNSKAFIFRNPNIWSAKRQQPNLVDITSVERVALVDSVKEEVIDYLEIIDPLKGKISGLAEQEIKYKSVTDPAIYSIGRPGVIVDDENNWLDDHVGELWWDLSSVKYIWYEQGDEIFRKNNWGTLFPGATIDVYEWVRSDLLPSTYSAQADTNEGITLGISGQPKFPSNDVISVKQIYNSVTGNFENVYYFWVKNKLIVPNVKNRRLTSYQVASLIVDPVANGIKFAEILSSDSVAFANVQNMLIDSRISASFSFNNNNIIPRHTEWQLLSEGNANHVPPSIIENKLFDSLCGEDFEGVPVPDPTLSYRSRYGIGYRPKQTIFKNRTEALRNLVVYVNDVFSKEKIVSTCDLTILLSQDEIPDISLGQYDLLLNNINELSTVSTNNFIPASLLCNVNNGKITDITIVNAGQGYGVSPTITIGNNLNNASLSAVINSNGSIVDVIIDNPGSNFVEAPILTVRKLTVIVSSNSEVNGRWTKHEYNNQNNAWSMIYTQKYRVTDYWQYVNWVDSNFDELQNYAYVVNTISELVTYKDIAAGSYIKVNNNGIGKYIIVEKSVGRGNFTEYFDILFIEDGTIQLLDKLWNKDQSLFGYDEITLAETLYDQSSALEVRKILTALKNDIFVGSLKFYYNSLFFNLVRYALTEQKLLDWAFKTSFINVTTDLGTLDQRPVYKLDNEKYFEEYIREIKPYHTQIRNYSSKYNSIEEYDGNITDFDLPTYYNQSTGKFTPITILASTSSAVFTVTNTLTNVYPWKNWADNYTYFVKEVLIADGGQGYTQKPIVTFNTVPGDNGSGATAEAFIRAGKVNKILITNPGSGYILPPSLNISNGGAGVTNSGTYSVVLGNETIRKNKVMLKFDRVSDSVEQVDSEVLDRFVSYGQNTFILTWLADSNKSNMTVTVNGKVVFSTKYRLEYFSQDYEGFYSKEYTRLVLLDIVPAVGDIVKVKYRKNIKLFTAVERIEQSYAPTEGMISNNITDLISGLDYPLTTYEGMLFTDTAPWGTAGYDTAPWDDIVSEYVSVKLLQDIQPATTTIYVSTTTGITTGQSIIIGNTSSIKIREGTIVTQINTAGSLITISYPYYNLKSARSTATAIGSVITFKTKKDFRGDIRVGDNVIISGVLESGYDGQYSIFTTTNSTFKVYATQVLNSTTSQLSTISATARVLSILSTVSSATNVLDTVVVSTTNTTTLLVNTYALYNQMATATVTFSSGSPTWYITTSTGAAQRAVVNISGLNPANLVTATINIYGYVDIDFWKYNLDPDYLDVSIESGSWQLQSGQPVKVGALGTTATDNIIQGGGWIQPVGQYYGYKLSTTVPGTTATVYADAIDKFYLRYLYRHADQAGLDYWVGAIVNNIATLEQVESSIKVSTESQQIFASFNPDGLINPFRSYAPEEYVPGHTQDSVSISVYTRPERVSPIMFNGAFYIPAETETTATITLLTDEVPAGLLVTFNGTLLTRFAAYPVGDYDSVYYLSGNTLTIPKQYVGGRVGYSYVTAASESGIDSQYSSVYSTGTQTTVLASDLAYSEVGAVYVTIDGNRVNQYVSGSSVGYIVEPVGTSNKRCSVRVIYIPSGRHEIVAWFFKSYYETFNKINESFYPITTSTYYVDVGSLPYTIEPISSQIIVEHVDTYQYQPNRTRLMPPAISYYEVVAGQTTFDINNKKSGQTYSYQNVKVYLNGFELMAGFDYIITPATETVTIIQDILSAGDVLAIEDYLFYDFFIENNKIRLKDPVSTGYIKMIHFNDHDDMGMRTEWFTTSHNNEYSLSLPLISENYVWVTANNKTLIAGYDFLVKEDLQTIIIADHIPMTSTSEIIITSINPRNYSNKLVGFRIFKDIFGKSSYKRISKYFTTKLSQPLNYYDSSVHVEDGAVLFAPNPSRNIPGVIFVDSERIEYFVKNGNELTQLRRGTYGTGVPWYSAAGTLVYDQSLKQNVLTEETANIQHIPTSNTNTYTISTVTNTSSFSVSSTSSVGNGIILLTTSTSGIIPAAVDQVEVYFGGRRLRKESLKYHYNDRAYDTTSSVYYNGDYTASYEILAPEFSIVTATQQLVLNISEEITQGTKITVIQRKGRVWDITTASILESTTQQAKFLRAGPAELPSVYYYGGSLELTDENNNPLTEDDGDLLQGL